MQKLQLYIEGQRIDLFKDESVSFTQTIQNVKDIKKIFTEFTKTFSVPASKKNNIIFKHYYNFDIQGGYDARNKQDATLELNDLPFKSGKIKLEGVDLKNNVAHTYRITFFGNTVNLKDVLGDDQLADLSALSTPAHNQTYNTSNILSRLQSESDDIIVPLITHTDRMFYDSDIELYGNLYQNNSKPLNGINWNQFKYAIRVQAIITAIETNYPSIVFSDDFFNDATNDQFNELFLWLHRKSGAVETSSQVDVAWTSVPEFNTVSGTGSISSQLNGQVTITYYSSIDYNSVSASVTFEPDVLTQDYSVQILNSTGVVTTLGAGQGNRTTPSFNGLSDTYTVQVFSDTPITFGVGKITWEIDWVKTLLWDFEDGTKIYQNASSFDTNSDLEFNITEQIPKMKIIDFLSGLFKMFNLTAYIDATGTIVVRTLDSYYAESSNVINIDKYLDTTKSVVNVALPFKEIDFSYKGLGTFLAKQFEQINNTGWGSLSYTLNNNTFDAPSETYKIELPFEHLMYERLYNVANSMATKIQWGYFVNESQKPYFGSPLLFYPVLISGGEDIPILNTPVSSGRTVIDDYFIPSNSLALDCATSKINIHFNNEINEYTAAEVDNSPCFTDTLFETKYKTYIQDVFNESRRIVKVTAYLPMKVYYNLQLNDLIQLGQNNYKINSLTTNLTTGKTKFELLNTVL